MFIFFVILIIVRNVGLLFHVDVVSGKSMLFSYAVRLFLGIGRKRIYTLK